MQCNLWGRQRRFWFAKKNANAQNAIIKTGKYIAIFIYFN